MRRLLNMLELYRTILKNASALYIVHGVNILVPLITFPYLIRVIGLEGFGELNKYLAVIQSGLIFINLAFSYTATAHAARAEEQPVLSRLYWNVAWIRLMLAMLVISISTVGAYAIGLDSDERSVFWILQLMVLGEGLAPLWFFLGREKMALYSSVTVAGRMISVILLFSLVSSPDDLPEAAFVSAFPVLFAGLFAWVYLPSLGVSKRPTLEWKYAKTLALESILAFGSSFPSHIYAKGAALVLAALVGNVEFGRFAMAQKVTAILGGFVSPASQALYPMICRAVESKDRFASVRSKVLVGSYSSLAVCAAILFFLGAPILELISGGPQPKAAVYLQIMVPITIFSGTSVFLNLFVMASKKFQRLVKIYILASGIFLAVAWPLTQFMGVSGMILTMLLVEGSVTVGMIIVSRPRIEGSKR